MLSVHYERVISSDLTSSYFDFLEAPYKKLTWFENSTHAPQFEELVSFNTTIVEIAKQIDLL
jgi:proline iminopeptidase